jgi:2-amino-4-hydroxy-6-hydroxymethyldihydropteridine diphosphokinase
LESKFTDTGQIAWFFIVMGFNLQGMNYAYLLTGANLGKREEQLAFAANLLRERCGTIIDRSSLYETAPWGKTDQPNFLNQALVIETDLSARETLNLILSIENLMGRDRTEKNGPRIIDVDILFFNHQIIREPGLVIPHPEMANRRFVLEPLNEIAPAFIHPVSYKPVSQLLMECGDLLPVKKI